MYSIPLESLPHITKIISLNHFGNFNGSYFPDTAARITFQYVRLQLAPYTVELLTDEILNIPYELG